MENISNAPAVIGAEKVEQYSLAKILSIWALAAIPMGVLSWLVFPALSPDSGSDPLGAGLTRIVLLTFGLIWLFVLSMIIVRQEEGDLRWATVKRRLRLNPPRDPETGETRPTQRFDPQSQRPSRKTWRLARFFGCRHHQGAFERH